MLESSRLRPRRRAAVIERHVMQRLRTVDVLERQAGLEVIHAGESVTSLMAWMRRQDRSSWPHLLLIELLPLDEPERDAAAIAALRDAGMRVLLVSSLAPRRAARKVMGIGVDGVVSKLDSEAALIDSVAAVLAGETAITEQARAVLNPSPETPQLSTQELKVLELYTAGQSIASVAEIIGVRQDTARKYLARVKQKYAAVGRSARSKLELRRRASEDGLGP